MVTVSSTEILRASLVVAPTNSFDAELAAGVAAVNAITKLSVRMISMIVRD